MKETAARVGARIRYLRLQKELSQEKLALDAGINPAFLGHLERGLKSPTVDTLAKIASALNITLSELVDIDSDNNENNAVIEKIAMSVKGLSPEDAARVAHIVSEITKLRGNTN